MDKIKSNELILADKIAHDIGSRWRTVEIEDLNSHLYVWLYENATHVQRYRFDDGDGRLFVSLRREAIKYCAAETAAKINRPILEDDFYNREMLKRALPFMFEGYPEMASPVNPVTDEAIGEGSSGEALAILTDLTIAFNQLPQTDKILLGLRYRDGLSLNEIADIRGVGKSGAAEALSRAISRLLQILIRKSFS